ncbi:unnamed protein product [Cladocopium goreaui]|uniref:Uncharacterized protein n=1 Tax=Cladocopium goreaui TaxID=2562237 RepID=A0A9P1CD44_9DINO|nr:unnamed protein product [Cladocopium goreaui]
MGKKRIQTTASTEVTRLAEDKDLGISYGPGPDGNKFDIFMQEETDGVVAAERISRILKAPSGRARPKAPSFKGTVDR